MPKLKILKNIPEEDLEKIVEKFESEGGKVDKLQQLNGLWTVRALIPDTKVNR